MNLKSIPSAGGKIVMTPHTASVGRALYSRNGIPSERDGPFCHHMGLYVCRREALSRFVSLRQTHLEKSERLEPLRGLEHSYRGTLLTQTKGVLQGPHILDHEAG